MELPPYLANRLSARMRPKAHGAWPPPWPLAQWATWELVKAADAGNAEAAHELASRNEKTEDLYA